MIRKAVMYATGPDCHESWMKTPHLHYCAGHSILLNLILMVRKWSLADNCAGCRSYYSPQIPIDIISVLTLVLWPLGRKLGALSVRRLSTI